MSEAEIQNMAGAAEAILFVYGEPMEVKRIAKILNPNDPNPEFEEIVKKALENLNQQYKNENRGLKLIFSDLPGGQRVQLATKPEFASITESVIKEESKENLTPAALETLSLIAYMSPISRAQIDFYRGVNSSFILRALLVRGLIERFQDPKRANIYLYQPSFDLLKYLGISKIGELPEYEKYKSQIQNN